jgi:hypothetical protein
MVSIEVDEEVYNALKKMAEPFVDTPNTVLRRILKFDSIPEESITINRPFSVSRSRSSERVLSEVFMSSYLTVQYKEKFMVRSPYRAMFESGNYLVYFQNFNKAGTANLWYRLNEDSLKVLRSTNKAAHVCFTNPAEKFAYQIPMVDIDRQAEKAKWTKNFYEVNIDPVNSRWRELDWKIDKYYVSLNITDETK